MKSKMKRDIVEILKEVAITMKYAELKKIITECIYSKDLKVAIEKENSRFSAKKLMLIAYRFARTFKERTELLEMIADYTDNVKLKEYICDLIEWKKDVLKKFVQNDGDYIYELNIKEKPSSYDEKYVCNSFESALRMIPLFYEEYGEEETDEARYCVIKRKIFDAKKHSFSEDYAGSCDLLKNGVVEDADMDELRFLHESDKKSVDEYMQNNAINFPRFVPHGGLVKYKKRDGSICFGVNLEMESNVSDEYYIIPLKSDAMKYGRYDCVFDYHEHIDAPWVENASVSELGTELRKRYEEYVKYLEEAWN